MVKKLTTNKSAISALLNGNFPSNGAGFRVQIPAISHHFVDRLGTRKLSPIQAQTLGQIARGSLYFESGEVSEIRFIEHEGKSMPISVVVNDVVLGVHPLNMGQAFAEFGLREGKGTAIAKTVLARPNERNKPSTMIDGWRVI